MGRHHTCPHGMPNRPSCIDCMFEHGLGVAPSTIHRGLYSKCMDLMRGGVDDIDVPSKVIDTLTDEDRYELSLIALRAYAAQARRVLAKEAAKADRARYDHPTKVRQREIMKHWWDTARERGFNNLGDHRKWCSDEYRKSLVAMGDGTRIERGEMTVSDLSRKIDALTTQRDGFNNSINEFDSQRQFLIENSVRSLNDWFEDIAAEAEAS